MFQCQATNLQNKSWSNACFAQLKKSRRAITTFHRKGMARPKKRRRPLAICGSDRQEMGRREEREPIRANSSFSPFFSPSPLCRWLCPLVELFSLSLPPSATHRRRMDADLDCHHRVCVKYRYFPSEERDRPRKVFSKVVNNAIWCALHKLKRKIASSTQYCCTYTITSAVGVSNFNSFFGGMRREEDAFFFSSLLPNSPSPRGYRVSCMCEGVAGGSNRRWQKKLACSSSVWKLVLLRTYYCQFASHTSSTLEVSGETQAKLSGVGC